MDFHRIAAKIAARPVDSSSGRVVLAMEITDYVIRVGPAEWIMTPYQENVLEHLDAESAPAVSAQEILDLIAEKNVTLVMDPGDNWAVKDMAGSQVTVNDLQAMLAMPW